MQLAPRAAEIADDLRAIVPASSSSDEPTIRLLALVLARVEAANNWLAEKGIFRDAKGNVQPVIKSLSTWENTAGRLLDQLGLTPTSRAKLGVHLAHVKGEALRAHLADAYAEPEPEDAEVEEDGASS